MIGEVVEISQVVAWDFLQPRHYAGRKPQITVAFGWKVEGKIVAVCTFGKPATPFICTGVCGDAWASHVYELNRLCRIDSCDLQLSQFVGACLRNLT